MATIKIRFKNLDLRFKKWIKENKVEAIILLLILLIGSFFRLYKISEYMTFLGDEGRDVIVVKRLLTDFDPILVGPGTSIGNMYLGPLYYYMMAPSLLLANFSPVGPAVMVALLGVAAIFLVWYIAREWFGKKAAVIASFLYAITPIVIIYSRSSWNPNIMPIFSLLTIYSIWQFWERKMYKWLIVAGIFMAFVLQSHYLGLLLAPVVGFFWILSLFRLRVTRFVLNIFKPTTRNALTDEQNNFVRYSILGFLLFTLLMSPLVIFDARHEWRNFEAIKTFFMERQTTISARPWTAFPKLKPLAEKISTRLVTGTDSKAGGRALIGILLGILWLITFNWRTLKGKEKKAYLLISVWLIFALVGLGIYKQEIYDHYYGFFFAAPFLLVGGISQGIVNNSKKTGLVVVVLILGWLSYINLANNPLKYTPNRQLQRTTEVVKAVSKYSEGKAFNFAVIAERNYEGAYMYFFEMWGIPAYIPIADMLDETLKDQLFVVCEVTGERCNPETNERPELANFGWRKVVASWEESGVTIHKVIHAQ